MDTSFSPEDIAFRDEVRAFFAEAYDDDLRARMDDQDNYRTAMVDWQKRLFEKGWIAPNWPVEHGGTGWTLVQKHISFPFPSRFKITEQLAGYKRERPPLIGNA